MSLQLGIDLDNTIIDYDAAFLAAADACGIPVRVTFGGKSFANGNVEMKLRTETDPKKAEPGTIRARFAESIEANSVHGSDSAENAATEIAFFFAGTEIVG